MSRPVRWLVGGLGVLVALGLVAALAVVVQLDPVRVRDQLAAIVHEQTGRELRIARPVELSVFPSLGVVLREVELGGSTAAGEAPPARAAELRVRVAVASLLSGNPALESLTLRGLVVPLGRDAKGEQRWTLRGDGTLVLEAQAAPVRQGQLDLAVRATGESLPPEGIALSLRAGVRHDLASRELALPAVLGRLEANLPFRADAGALAIDDLRLTLDDTTVTGRLAVNHSTGALAFDLAADRLDLDRYLPRPAPSAPAAAPAGDVPGPPPAGGALVAGGALPPDALRALDLDGSLRVGALKAGGARLTDVRTHWRAKSGVITQVAEAKLYGGSARSTSTLDVTAGPPAASLEGALQGIELSGLLADTTGQSRLSGVAHIDADLRWSGLSEAEVERSLDGTARLALRNGAVQGFDLDGLVRNALARVLGRTAAGLGRQTEFSELTATLAARNGVLSNHDLRATSALLGLTGAGTIDLPANRIDYLAKATLHESAAGLLGERLADLRDAPIPVRITGPLDAPTVALDVEEVLRSRAGQYLQRRIEERLKGEWGDKLKRFLDR